ncbi:hypothetical protein CSPHI_03445 [Corynebacterium sphenisci DSM 44792]|uniref:Uncharacterized protein n=1 Tax=Corynebacterium sphenisci DSM 44792 TaxID=1437874 RepID=A0A1L7CWU1_9CORY|nr:hypothetical protein CSPHI_03445 [Corynebacterium sphenisci DSM 44792]
MESVQPYLKYLVEDLGYPPECIQSHPQWRVKTRPSDNQKSVPVDIAVFRDARKLPDDLIMIVECKRKGANPEDSHDRQIFNYLNWSSAVIGTWTNGETRLNWVKEQVNGQLDYRELPTVPRYGESLEEVGRYRRDQLTKPRNLQQVFRAIRAHLAGNARGTTRDEAIATEMINLIFCKIYDEMYTKPQELVEFRAATGESEAEVHERITSLFDNVRTMYNDVFSENDTLALDPASVKFVVGELQTFCLTEAGRDAVGEAFEVFIGGTLKGEQGQFFTPRNVIRLMVQLTNPGKDHLVIDPACGAGGFLIETLRQKWNAIDRLGRENGWKELSIAKEKTACAMKTIHGLDKDDFLVKVAKAYMAIMGDGKGNIFSEDSLEKPDNWRNASRFVQLNNYDIVLANPPFGKEIKVRGADKLSQFRLAHKWRGRQEVEPSTLLQECNPQVLFVERCLQLAKPGGYVGIILPEIYFHGPSVQNVREVLLGENNVVALIDLPHNTFRPFNNAKCVAAIVQKGVKQQEFIKMVVAQEMGHDHLGRPIFRMGGPAGGQGAPIWDDITDAADALEAGVHSDLVFEVSATELAREDIWVPRYYWHGFNEDVSLPSSYPAEWITIQELEDRGIISTRPGHGSPKSAFKGRGKFTYARVKDIVNWEIYRDPTSAISEDVARDFTDKFRLEPLDVVYVSRGSYRIGDVALVGPNDVDTILTRELHVLRVLEDNALGMTPYYLLYLLTTPQVKLQTQARVFLDTTLPNIGDRYKSIRLPIAKDKVIRKELSEKVRSAVEARWIAMEDIRELLQEESFD